MSPQELLAMEQSQAGIGSYQPYLDRQEAAIMEGMGASRSAEGLQQPYFDRQQSLIDQAVSQARRAEALQDPYLGRAEQQYGQGLQSLLAGTQESGDISRQAAGMQFDPSQTQAFYDPYENQVVQQTIDDMTKSAEIADATQRARDIASGGESAFGSRARLTADERRASLGRGLGEALSRIRSSGFNQSQAAAQQDFARRQAAQERLADNISSLGAQSAAGQRGFGTDLAGLGTQRGGIASTLGRELSGLGTQFGRLGTDISGARRGLGADIAGYGSQIGHLGTTQSNLAQGQRRELAGFGQAARGLDETRLGRTYDQALATRMAPTQASSYVQSFLPQYQSGKTQIDKTYGIPADPATMGLGTFFNTWASFAKNNQQQNPNQQVTQPQGGQQTGAAYNPAINPAYNPAINPAYNPVPMTTATPPLTNQSPYASTGPITRSPYDLGQPSGVPSYVPPIPQYPQPAPPGVGTGIPPPYPTGG